MFLFLIASLIIINLIYSKNDKNTALYMMLFLTLLVTALRFGIGSDYFSYEFIYNRLKVDTFASMINSQTKTEVGFRILMYFGRILNLPYHVFITLVAFLILFFVALIGKKSKAKSHQVFMVYIGLFYFSWALNAVRQGIIMVVATYILFYNNKLNLRHKLMSIVALSTIHISALAIIPIYLLANYVEWSRTKFVILLVIFFVISRIPLETILIKLDMIPYLYKMASYLKNPTTRLFTFPMMLRLFMISITLISYNKLIESNEAVTNYTLLFLSLYILFSRNNLFAGRISVYGYFMMSILLPLIFSYYSIPQLSAIGLAFVSLFFYYKDHVAVLEQAGYSKDLIAMNKTTILNYNREDWFNRYNLNNRLETKADKLYDEFLSKLKEIENTKYQDGLYHFVEKNPLTNKLEIINENFERVPTEAPLKAGRLFGPYQDIRAGQGKYLYANYINVLTGEEADLNLVNKYYLEYQAYSNKINQVPIKTQTVNLKDLNIPLIDKYIVDEEGILRINVSVFSKPTNYRIVEIVYDTQRLYALLDENNKPMVDILFSNIGKYPGTHVVDAQTFEYKFKINLKGEIIWMSPK